MPKNVLVVDDDLVQRRALEETIRRFGYAVTTVDTGERAIATLKADASGDISLVLLDLVMPRTGGMAVLSALRSLPRRYPAIVLTADGNIEAAMAAMGAGAVDFAVKPVSPERLEVSIKNALKIDALEGEINRMKASARDELGVADLVAGEAMARVVDRGRRAAQSSIPVLIEGESGVGKAMIARAIHGESARAGKPFVTVNCSAIPQNEIESRLFGEGPGKPGKIIEADRGTLFLDEIGELPLQAQARLLRLLQVGEVATLGEGHPIKADIRLIAATNQDLIALVREGRLREDLYYRLNVFPIWVPPLRGRLDDMAELVRLFIARFAAEEGKRVDGISPEALAMLRRYSWPGNIRQLENAVFRAVVLADEPMLTPEEFPQIAALVEGGVALPVRPAPSMVPVEEPLELHAASDAVPVDPEPPPGDGLAPFDGDGDVRPLAEIEAEMIRLALDRYRGRMSLAARKLGIGRSTLYRKLKELGISDTVAGIAAE